MHYRNALPRDLDDIIAIHVEGGQRAYARILPAKYLLNVMPQEKRVLWSARLKDGVDKARMSVVVAEQEND